MHAPIVILKSVSKSFGILDAKVFALHGISFEINTGDFATLAGSSGCGKTTCLNLIGGLDKSDAGTLIVNGQDLGQMTDNQVSDFRRFNLGFVFQYFNLFAVLTALENIEYPLLRHSHISAKERRERALKLLARVGLEKHSHKYPDQLSGGQRQRVAIARALIHKPKLVLADEPTANLDRKTAREIIELMSELNHEEKISFVFSTHDAEIIAKARTRVFMSDGQVERFEKV